jgi:putative solute:sodium symporter small subunit
MTNFQGKEAKWHKTTFTRGQAVSRLLHNLQVKRFCNHSFFEEVFMSTHTHDSIAYWKATLALIRNVLIVWFVCSYGMGILFAPALNSISIGGYPLGFWFAQQGSIYIFIALIFYYAKAIGKIDKQFDVAED